MENRYKESNKITIKNIIGNVILSASKLIGGVVGSSTSLIADGIHSLSDILTSISVLIGNKIAAEPSDKEHNYGHEKVEVLVAFTLSLFLIYVALSIGSGAVELIFNPENIKVPTKLPIIVAIISILLKEYQYKSTMKIANKINSEALKADALHHRSDSLSSIAVLVGVVGSLLGYKILEPIASLFVTVCILHAAIEIFKSSSSELLDESIGEDTETKIREFIKSTKLANNVSTIKSRKHGSTAFIDIDVCIDGSLSIREGHKIAHKIEDLLLENFNNIKSANIHIEPCAGKECTNKYHCKSSIIH